MRTWLCCLFTIFISVSEASTAPSLLLEKKAQAFINEMVKNYHFNREELTQILSQAKYDPEVINRITHPYEAKPWNFYRAYFITEKRIQDGINYWEKHRH